MKKISLVCLLSVTILVYGYPQKQTEEIVTGQYRSFSSNILGGDITYLVRLPEGYDKGKRKYPVLYLMNAQMTSTLSIAVGILENLEFEMVPSMILVGISNTGKAEKFFPIQPDGKSDQADTFLRFLNEELIPFIDRQYRTEDYRILTGQSNAALFVLYALFSQPDSFNAYFAFSPSLGWGLDFMKEKAASFSSRRDQSSQYLYMNQGGRDYPELVIEPMKKFVETLKKLSVQGFGWELDRLDRDGHVPVSSLNYGLLSLFPDFYATDDLKNKGLKAVDNHYKKLTQRYGFHIEAPEEVLFHMSYTLQQNKNFEKAVDMFKELIYRYPGSFLAHFYLGRTYEELGEMKSAEKYFIKTLELNPDFQPAKNKLQMIRKK